VEHVTSADGTRIAYERRGSGQPLVLVHGTSVERFTFRFVEPLLIDRFTLYAVDRRGRGESGDSTGEGHIAIMTAPELVAGEVARFLGK
jgi:pimeloyl-ACP methyl ester carboxylesterase